MVLASSMEDGATLPARDREIGVVKSGDGKPLFRRACISRDFVSADIGGFGRGPVGGPVGGGSGGGFSDLGERHLLDESNIEHLVAMSHGSKPVHFEASLNSESFLISAKIIEEIHVNFKISVLK